MTFAQIYFSFSCYLLNITDIAENQLAVPAAEDGEVSAAGSRISPKFETRIAGIRPRKKIDSRVCVFERRTLAKTAQISFFGPPIPSLRTVGRCSTAYESHAEQHAPITAGLSVI